MGPNGLSVAVRRTGVPPAGHPCASPGMDNLHSLVRKLAEGRVLRPGVSDYPGYLRRADRIVRRHRAELFGAGEHIRIGGAAHEDAFHGGFVGVLQ